MSTDISSSFDTATEIATFGGGCFWCIEAVFNEIDGVTTAASGYAGGNVDDPTYEDVCGKRTGHAEVIQVEFDPSVISYHDLLAIFFDVHDPTTLNRQGNDVGPQYRSVVMYHDEEQRAVAERVINEIDAIKLWGRPIVTELVPLRTFYKAEAYHQRYFINNPNQGYCSVVVAPKLKKFRQKYANQLKQPVLA